LSDESNWRVVILDPYEESIMTEGGGRIGHELTLENGGIDSNSLALCQSHNPNNLLDGSNFLKGLSGVDARWVPYNGAISDKQLDWLESVLSESVRNGEKVLVFSHVVLHPRATPNEDCHALLWNYGQVLELFDRYGCVRLVIAGHAHREGYHHCSETKVHHVTIASPLEAPDDLVEETFGILEIEETHANLIGRGWVRSRRMDFK
jgi:manganese-dependent ADP-ribose/CDP-alcohol diphosphatase